MTTLQPLEASILLTASPRPCAPPVTIATCSEKVAILRECLQRPAPPTTTSHTHFTAKFWRGCAFIINFYVPLPQNKMAGSMSGQTKLPPSRYDEDNLLLEEETLVIFMLLILFSPYPLLCLFFFSFLIEERIQVVT